MLSDASVLFQIAGIGIIVALIHTILKQMGKEENRAICHVGRIYYSPCCRHKRVI